MHPNAQILRYPDFDSGNIVHKETPNRYSLELPLCTKPIKAELDAFFVKYCKEDLSRSYLLHNTNIESTQINTLGKTLYKYSIHVYMDRHFVFDPFAKRDVTDKIKSFAERLDIALRLKELQRN